MKKNTINLLLLSAMLTGALAGCDQGGQESESPQVTETGSETEQEQVRVTLNRKIYLRSDDVIKSGMLDCKKIETWSSALNDYKEYTNVTANLFTIPATGTGLMNVEVKVGKKSTDVEVEIYDTAEQAALAHPVSQDLLDAVDFNLENYNANKKKGYKTYNDVELFGDTFYVNPTSSQLDGLQSFPFKFTDDAHAIARAQYYKWNQVFSVLFTSTDKNPCVSVLDPTRKTVPHKPATPADITHVLDTVHQCYEQVWTNVDYSQTYCFEKDANFNYREGLTLQGGDDVLAGTSSHESEMIIDAHGRICYVGVVHASASGYTNIALADKDLWFCDPYYDTNDYSTVAGAKANTNPAFLFADDYDPTDDVKKYHFEKVVPQGGFYIIGQYPNGNFESTPDQIWKVASGLNKTVEASQSSFAVPTEESLNANYEIAKNNLANSYVTIKSGEVATSMIKPYNVDGEAVCYTKADSIDIYSLLYKLSQDDGDPTLLALGDTVIEALKYQEIDFIKTEPVLLKYYSDKTIETMESWKNVFFPAE